MARFDQAFHQIDHFGDVSGGSRFVCGRYDSELGVSRIKAAFVQISPSPPRFINLTGFREDLVVNIRDVANEGYVVAAVSQPATKNVEGDGRTHMSNVRLRLDGGATHIDRGQPWPQRLEFTQTARSCVVDMQRHPTRLARSMRSRGLRRLE